LAGGKKRGSGSEAWFYGRTNLLHNDGKISMPAPDKKCGTQSQIDGVKIQMDRARDRYADGGIILWLVKLF